MKKFLSLMVVTLVGLLPFVVNAASSISPGSDCGQLDSEGNSRCTVHYKIDDQDGLTSMIITLTEKGGATVTNVDNIAGSEWTISDQKHEGNVYTITLTSPGVKGEGDLFYFTYKGSGEDDCTVAIGYNGQVQSTPTPTPNTPEDNKDTGSALPYVALGTIALVAVGAYLATRNKTKLYKI